MLRQEIARFRGREVKTLGDGILATFDGPARAVRCASQIGQAARSLALEVRSGVHTGEIEVKGNDIAGIAVHIAARVASLAQGGKCWFRVPSAILCRARVSDLKTGSEDAEGYSRGVQIVLTRELTIAIQRPRSTRRLPPCWSLASNSV